MAKCLGRPRQGRSYTRWSGGLGRWWRRSSYTTIRARRWRSWLPGLASEWQSDGGHAWRGSTRRGLGYERHIIPVLHVLILRWWRLRRCGFSRGRAKASGRRTVTSRCTVRGLDRRRLVSGGSGRRIWRSSSMGSVWRDRGRCIGIDTGSGGRNGGCHRDGLRRLISESRLDS